MRSSLTALGLLAVLAVLAGCQPSSSSVPPSAPATGESAPGASAPASVDQAPPGASAFSLTSAAFAEGEAIPAVHSCDGDEVSPPLEWSGAPDGTVAFALIAHDPDAGGFVHWVVGNLSGILANLPEGESGALPGEAAQGENGAGGIGWLGMCPPSGTHSYVFTLYALSEPAGVSEGVTAGDLLTAMEGKVLDQAVLTGTFSR